MAFLTPPDSEQIFFPAVVNIFLFNSYFFKGPLPMGSHWLGRSLKKTLIHASVSHQPQESTSSPLLYPSSASFSESWKTSTTL